MVGAEYERPYLAELWGYRGFQAISRGVVTPSGTNKIILFVTEEKQQALTNSRVVNASSANDEVHLFHRRIHHSPFVYLGQIKLLEHNLLVDDPRMRGCERCQVKRGATWSITGTANSSERSAGWRIGA